MIKVINIILFLVCAVLAWLLFKSINDPMKYQKEISTKNEAVYDKLYKIRDAQEAFKSVKGVYANDFDTLIKVMKYGKFKTTNFETKEESFIPIVDSIFKGDVAAIDGLPLVPNGNGAKFNIGAGNLPSPSDSTVILPVFEASTMRDIYLKGVNKDYWANKKVKIGSLSAPILTGNWE